jgi:hypothetical protein
VLKQKSVLFVSNLVAQVGTVCTCDFDPHLYLRANNFLNVVCLVILQLVLCMVEMLLTMRKVCLS